MPHPDLPQAEERLNRYRRNVQLAQQAHDEARTALAETRKALDEAQLALDAAEDVFNAAVRDTGAPLTAMQPHTIRWLHELPKGIVFGTTEAEDAARAVGWPVSPASLRQTLKRMVSLRILERQARGDYRLNSRSLDRLPEDETSEDAQPPASTLPAIGDVDTVQEVAADTAPLRDESAGSDDDDWMDDDTPF